MRSHIGVAFKELTLAVLVAVLVASCRPADREAEPTDSPAIDASSDSLSVAALFARADKGRIQGDTSAPVWFVEISDFQCPYCKRWHEEVYPVLRRDYIETGRIRMAYLNFPLRQHQHAIAAAAAAMCAAAQDRFWPVHDALFRTQERWASLPDAAASFDSIATSVVANPAEWRACLRSHVMQRLISADRARAASAKIRTTPSFFIGDEKIEGLAPLDTFRAAINRALAKKR